MLASKLCQEGLDKYPDDANILCLAGEALIALKQFDEARSHIEKARSLYPHFAATHEIFADLLLLEGHFEKAIESYRHCMKLDASRLQLNDKIKRARE